MRTRKFSLSLHWESDPMPPRIKKKPNESIALSLASPSPFGLYLYIHTCLCKKEKKKRVDKEIDKQKKKKKNFSASLKYLNLNIRELINSKRFAELAFFWNHSRPLDRFLVDRNSCGIIKNVHTTTDGTNICTAVRWTMPAREIEPGSGFSLPFPSSLCRSIVSFFCVCVCFLIGVTIHHSFPSLFFLFLFGKIIRVFETKNGLEMTWILPLFVCVCVVPFGFDRNRHQCNLAADVGTGRCDRSARCGLCGVYSSSAKNLRVSIILDRVNVHYCPVFHMSNGR